MSMQCTVSAIMHSYYTQISLGKKRVMKYKGILMLTMELREEVVVWTFGEL